jgi:hypothetical protein
MTYQSRTLTLIAGIAASVIALAAPAPAGAQPEVFTQVDHSGERLRSRSKSPHLCLERTKDRSHTR